MSIETLTPDYQLSQLLGIHGEGDPRTSVFSTFYCKIWVLVIVYAVLSLLYLVWFPKFKKTRGTYKAIEAWIVVYNGFMFGCYGTGLGISYYVTNGYQTFNDCSPINYNAIDAKATLTVLMAISLNYIKLLRFLEPLFYKVAGKKVPFSGIITTEGVIVHLLAIMPLKYSCGNFFTFGTFLDGICMVSFYAHQTLKCGGFIADHFQTWHHWNVALQIISRYYVFKQSIWGLESPDCQTNEITRPLIILQYWGTMLSLGFYLVDLFINGQQLWKDEEAEDESCPQIKHLKSS